MPDLRTPFEGAPAPAPRTQARGNLPSAAIAETIKRAGLKTVKRVFLFLLVIVLATFVGTSWKDAFATGSISAGAIAAPILFASFFPYAVLSLRWNAVILMNILAALVMVLPASDLGAPLALVVNALLIALLETAAWSSIVGRLRTYIVFKMSALAGGIGALIIAFSVLFTGLWYQTAIKPAISRGEFFVSERTFEKILTIAEPIAAKSFPGFRANLTVGNFIDMADDPANAALLVAQLSDRIGRPIRQTETVASVLQSYVGAEWNSLPPPLPRFALAGVVTFAFLFAWSIGVAARPVATIVSWIFLQLLIGMRLFGIVRETTEQKRLELL